MRYKLLVFLSLILGVHGFEINIPVQYDTLQNGLRLIIVPDTNVAVVSCRLYYFMGSMYEGPGTSGLSHMYEHMMFKGTKRLGTTDYKKELAYMSAIDSIDLIIGEMRSRPVPYTGSEYTKHREAIFDILTEQRKYIKKDEIWETFLNNGGTHLNAWTGDDLTAYIVTLPKNKLELFFWIESDRMQDPVLREFYSERDVVKEERRMRYDNKPINAYYEKLMAHFYLAHPYRIPTIGWMSDINAYTRKRLRNHVKRYYTPDNALVVIVGNIDSQEVMALAKKYFESIPRAEIPKEEVVTREPVAIGQTRFTVVDKAQPRIDILFQAPGYPSKDLFKLDVVESILSGRSGRLYKRLVVDEELCTNAGAANPYRLHNGYFQLYATLKSGVDPCKVEEIILDEVYNLVDNPPSKREMMRIKNMLQMHFINSLESLEGLSDQLARFERLNSWRDIMDYPKEIAEVKSEYIPAIIKKYFKKETMTVGLLKNEE